MNRSVVLVFACSALASSVAFADPDCCPVTPAPMPAPHAATPAATGSEATAGHPLRGVVVAVVAEKSALLVKHEEIPGVMRAMTMLLKVDTSTLGAAQKGQAITATLIKKADGWWLENVQVATDSK